MRTLLLAPALFASDGGIERMMRLYLKGLCDNAAPGDAVDVAILNDDPDDDGRMDAYATGALREHLFGRRRRARFALRVLWMARRCDRIVCGHVNLLPLASLAQRMQWRSELHLVAHGIEVWRQWTPSQRRALRRRCRVVAVSEFTRQRVLERCPDLQRSRTCVVPNTLDPNLPDPGPVARVPGLIVTMSRLRESDNYKGIDHLIAALPTIRRRRPDAQLLVIGDGDDRARLEQLSAQHAAGAVEFAGHLPDAIARARLAAAALFALPSRDEGFGLVYLEALSLGIPCIAARAGGTPEVVDETVGTLVAYGDVPGLAGACADALDRGWPAVELKRRAARLSYPVFRDNLSRALNLAP